jgi:hypothetical protein
MGIPTYRASPELGPSPFGARARAAGASRFNSHHRKQKKQTCSSSPHARLKLSSGLEQHGPILRGHMHADMQVICTTPAGRLEAKSKNERCPNILTRLRISSISDAGCGLVTRYANHLDIALFSISRSTTECLAPPLSTALGWLDWAELQITQITPPCSHLLSASPFSTSLHHAHTGTILPRIGTRASRTPHFSIYTSRPAPPPSQLSVFPRRVRQSEAFPTASGLAGRA